MEGASLYFYAPKIAETKVMQIFEPGTKVAQITAQFPWFEPGDNVVLRRGKLPAANT